MLPSPAHSLGQISQQSPYKIRVFQAQCFLAVDADPVDRQCQPGCSPIIPVRPGGQGNNPIMKLMLLAVLSEVNNDLNPFRQLSLCLLT